MRLRVVIPAGGHGRRLWPISRSAKPKFLLDVGSGEPLLHEVVRRALRIAAAGDIAVVTGRAHADLTIAAVHPFGLGPPVVEPHSRDTTAAIALGTFVAAAEDPDAIVVSLPADHLVRDDSGGWEATVALAATEAALGRLVCVGAQPTTGHTGYGYVQVARESRPSGAQAVIAFREKPDTATAQSYMEAGGYFWNTAIGVWRADVFARLMRRYAPDVAAVAEVAAEIWLETGAIPDAVWNDVRAVAIEYSLLEPAASDGFLSLVPASFRWWDVGSWFSVRDALGEDAGRSDVLLVDSADCVVFGHDRRRYAFLGMSDVIVIDAGDVVLVTRSSSAERVKDVADAARRHGWTDLV